MNSPRAGFGLVSLKTGYASDETNLLAIGGVHLNRESVSMIIKLVFINNRECL